MRRKTMENLQRDARLLAAVTKLRTRQLVPAVKFSLNIYHLNLRGGISFALPVPLVSLNSSTLSVQTSYLSPHPFPTLLGPSCDLVSHLRFPLVSLWSGYMYVGAGESSTSSAWGRSGLPEVMGTPCGWLHSVQA